MIDNELCNLCSLSIDDNDSFRVCYICRNRSHLHCIFDLEDTPQINIEWLCLRCSCDIFPMNNLISDREFARTVVNSEIRIEPNLEELNKLLLNPFNFNNTSDLLEDLDPDNNFFCQD